jgi:hypothetical protein
MTHLLGSSLILSLSATPESYPFPSKFIPLSRSMPPMILGIEHLASHSPSSSPKSPTSQSSLKSASQCYATVPDARNGWFPISYQSGSKLGQPSGESPGPVPVSQNHADIFILDGTLHIRDLDAGFGTFVNGAKISPRKPIPLKKGDIISLGHAIQRNNSTPSYITDEQLKPIVARVDLVGTQPT